MADAQPDMGPSGEGITPHLTIAGGRCKNALAFYAKAFNGTESFRMPAEDGERLLHAHMIIHGASLMLSDDFPEFSGRPPMTEPVGVTIHLQVNDADEAWELAIGAGADIVMPIGDQFWGARYGQVKDPFGHRWSIGGPLRK